MLESVTLTTGSALSAVTATTKTGKLVRAYIIGGDASTVATVSALAGNNLPATTIYAPGSTDLQAGVEITLPSVVYYANQHLSVTVTEASSVTVVLILDPCG
jgi:hypothetical protein